jgi:hypothetical protein
LQRRRVAPDIDLLDSGLARPLLGRLAALMRPTRSFLDSNRQVIVDRPPLASSRGVTKAALMFD